MWIKTQHLSQMEFMQNVLKNVQNVKALLRRRILVHFFVAISSAIFLSTKLHQVSAKFGD